MMPVCLNYRREKWYNTIMLIKPGDSVDVEKKYDIIYADPPWPYSNSSTRSSAKSQYDIMSMDDLASLRVGEVPIQDISKEKSVLLLWTTGPFLEVSFDIIKAWGFKYKTFGFNWVKVNKDGSIYTGMGNYTRANLEMCLLAQKGGGLPVQNHHIRNTHLHPRMKHSQKPPLFRNLIEELFENEETTYNKIEIFGRGIGQGWDGFGNEVREEPRGIF